MKVVLKGKQAQCPLCDRVFKSDGMCELHKLYRPAGATKGREFAKARCVDPTTIGMVSKEGVWTKPIPEEAKWWANNPAAPKATVHVLTCATCGKEWERPAQRGRKPHNCPECAAAKEEGK